MRLFVAINFSNELKARLLDARNKLSLCSRNGSFSNPENLHLTLVFIGECNTNEVLAVKSIMDSFSFPAFSIQLDKIGKFVREGGDIWWVGIKADAALFELQSTLTKKLIEQGFEIEQRPYKPHITIGRRVITDVGPWNADKFSEIVTSIELMKSERSNGKLVYTTLYTKKSAE